MQCMPCVHDIGTSYPLVREEKRALFGERIGIIGWTEQNKKDELTDQCVSKPDAPYLANQSSSALFSTHQELLSSLILRHM
jgi:hypothetical protein